MRYVIESKPKGEWCVREYNDQDELTREVPTAVSVTDACRTLKKSRRQLYRYMKDGWVKPVGKFLNEWLVDQNSLNQFLMVAESIKTRVPRRFQYRFPEFRVQDLHPIRDAVSITGPILELGGLREVRWLLRAYSRTWFVSFLKDHGPRLLSHRSLNFWCWWFHVEPLPTTWRQGWKALQGAAS